MEPLPGSELLVALRDLKDDLRVAALEALEKSAIEDLAEAALNVILGVIPTTEEQLASLRRHRKDLLELTGAKTTVARRVQLLGKGGLFRSVATAFDNNARRTKV